MKIRWLVEGQITLYELEYDKIGSLSSIFPGDTEEIDILENKGGNVDIQFCRGYVAFGVSSLWYEEI